LGLPPFGRSSQPSRHAVDALDVMLQAPSARRLLMATPYLGLLTCVAGRTHFDALGKSIRGCLGLFVSVHPDERGARPRM
jgi:hypothetical protein